MTPPAKSEILPPPLIGEALRFPFVRTVLSPLKGEMSAVLTEGFCIARSVFRCTCEVPPHQSLPCVKGGGVRKDTGGIDAEHSG